VKDFPIGADSINYLSALFAGKELLISEPALIRKIQRACAFELLKTISAAESAYAGSDADILQPTFSGSEVSWEKGGLSIQTSLAPIKLDAPGLPVLEKYQSLGESILLLYTTNFRGDWLWERPDPAVECSEIQSAGQFGSFLIEGYLLLLLRRALDCYDCDHCGADLISEVSPLLVELASLSRLSPSQKLLRQAVHWIYGDLSRRIAEDPDTISYVNLNFHLPWVHDAFIRSRVRQLVTSFVEESGH
jgi:hypothetical protein